MNLTPRHNNVLVKILPSEDKTPGGILLPDVSHQKVRRAEVVKVGPGTMDEDGFPKPIDLRTGQIVLLETYGGTEMIEWGQDKYLVIPEHGVLGVYEVVSDGRRGVDGDTPLSIQGSVLAIREFGFRRFDSARSPGSNAH